MHRATNEQVATHLPAHGLGHGLIHTKLVHARAALEEEVVQGVSDQVAGGEHMLAGPRAEVLPVPIAAPPACRKLAAEHMSFMSAYRAFEISGSGPLASTFTPLVTHSTWPSSSATMQANKL